MIRITSKRHRKGTVLLVSILAIVIGTMVSTSILKISTHTNRITEKEIGNIKCSQAAKLANSIYLTTVENTTAITNTEIQALQKRIGGNGSAQKPIFGYQNSTTPSDIPGFKQITVSFNDYKYEKGTDLLLPLSGNGFNYFNDVISHSIKAVYNDPHSNDVATFQNNTLAVIGEKNDLHVVPVFNMLAFYDRDLEFFAEEMGGFFVGRMHTNGNLYLTNINKHDGTEMRFHGINGYSILSAHGNVFRRGRGGLTSTYWPSPGWGSSNVNTDAQIGIEFYDYSESDYDNILDTTDFNVNEPDLTTAINARILRPDYTTCAISGSVEGDSYNPTQTDAQRRRYTGNSDSYGCKFKSDSSATGEPSFSVLDGSGDPYNMIDYQGDRLDPPVTITPYQYIEDTQYKDTPDTINYASPTPSNYEEDADADDNVATYAFNSIAPLVIRDGVAYQRTTPGGALSVVRGRADIAYPDNAHPDAKVYSDLRWYGHFGPGPATPDNPDRWHFPIKSVTINATQDANNAGDSATSAEGTAVPFTFRSAAIHNPVTDGVTVGNAPWIRRDIDLNGIPGYPPATAAAASNNEGDGVGMFNRNYPTLKYSIERYDPVRVAYNVVKAEVRKLYNSCHIYTSRHDGVVMLNANGSIPGGVHGSNVAPNVWGVGNMPNNIGVDYDDSDRDRDPTTQRNYSAFWNDDGGIGVPPVSGFYRYIRVNIDAGIGNMANFQVASVNFKTLEGGTWKNYPIDEDEAGGFTGLEVGDAGVNNGTAQVVVSTANGSNTPDNLYDIDVSGNEVISNASMWKPHPGDGNPHFIMDMGTGKQIGPSTMTMACDNNTNAPLNMRIWGSNDGTNWTQIKEFTNLVWGPGGSIQTFQLVPSSGTKYVYRRDPSGNPTFALHGELNLTAVDDTPAIELFPIRHKSLIDTGTAPTSMQDWFIYKSTLPLSNRTLPMPISRNNLIGWNIDTFDPANFDTLSPIGKSRTTNLGHAGLIDNDNSYHNWLTLLNNAPEMLVRQTSITHEVPANPPTTTSGLSYYAGEAGGYYGNDNLCMIDNQEKKIVVFTEIDMAELTEECFTFNNISTNFHTNTADVRSTEQLQNIIYVVNTSMGENFYGKRVNCGAVRIKRGRILEHPLSIASPNSVYVWGDYNCPGYWHHGPRQTDSNVDYIVNYNVPTSKEHDPTNTIESQPAAIYADTVQIIENNWIPFDQSDTPTNNDNITNVNMGSLISTAITTNLGYNFTEFSNSSLWDGSGHDFQTSDSILDFSNGSIWDHSLWWEDDGLRACGGTLGSGTADFNNGTRDIFLDNYLTPPANRTRGTQLFLNYHQLNFSSSLTYNIQIVNLNIFQRHEGGQIPLLKTMPQCIVGSFFYGNVEGKSPSVFTLADYNAITVGLPAGVEELDWLTSWIPRPQWVELSRTNLFDLCDDSSGSGVDKVDISNDLVGSFYDYGNLTVSDYYGFNANAYVEDEFEILKKRFGNIGFKLDIRSMHTYHFPVLPDWKNDASGNKRQNYTRNFIGAFACLFDSRQTTHSQREKDNSWEGRSMYCFNPELETQEGLPPGTPLTTSLANSKRTVGGTKWEY